MEPSTISLVAKDESSTVVTGDGCCDTWLVVSLPMRGPWFGPQSSGSACAAGARRMLGTSTVAATRDLLAWDMAVPSVEERGKSGLPKQAPDRP